MAFPACSAMGHWEFRHNSLTMRDMQHLVPDLYSVIYIVMVKKLMEKSKPATPFERKRYPQVSLNLNQEMERIKLAVLEVICVDNVSVKVHLTPHCPPCKTQPRLIYTLP